MNKIKWLLHGNYVCEKRAVLYATQECIDFCTHVIFCLQGCGRLKTPFEHATKVCSKYRERVRRLSGFGMQISPVARKISLTFLFIVHLQFIPNNKENP